MSDSVLDPHDKMRSRDVSKVARGEQAPRPPHEYGTVSKAPPPSSTDPKYKAAKKDEEETPRFSNRLRNCCIRYYEYHSLGNSVASVKFIENYLAKDEVRNFNFMLRTGVDDQGRNDTFRCKQENEIERDPRKCKKFAEEYQSLCSHEWIEKWDKERELGIFPGPL